MSFLRLPLLEDPAQVTARIIDGLRARLPGWQPREGQLDVALAEEIGREIADLRRLAVDVASSAVAALGRTVYQVPPIPGRTAVLQVRLTLTSAGRTVPAGLTVVGRSDDDGLDVAFTLPSSAPSVTEQVDVLMLAVASGSAANGVPAGPLTLVTATAAVVSAQALATSSEGLDPEDDDAYLDRLTASLSTLTEGAVLAEDFAVLARNVPGVHRALGIDNYDAATDTDGVERTVTVVPVEQDGDPVSPATADALSAYLQSLREVGFVVRVAAPTYTAVQVQFVVVADVGADPVQVQAAVRQAALDHLDPGRWAEGDDPTRPTWLPVREVRHLQLAQVMGSAPGVAYLDSLTINGVEADLLLPGRAPLPASTTAVDPTTVTGTAS